MEVANSGLRMKEGSPVVAGVSASGTGACRSTVTRIPSKSMPVIPSLSVYREAAFNEVLEIGIEEWSFKDSLSIFADGDKIERIHFALMDGCNSAEAAKSALVLADYLLLYHEAQLAYYFYYVVANFCNSHNSIGEVLHDSVLQIAKMIMIGEDIGVDSERPDPKVAAAMFVWLVDVFGSAEAESYFYCA